MRKNFTIFLFSFFVVMLSLPLIAGRESGNYTYLIGEGIIEGFGPSETVEKSSGDILILNGSGTFNVDTEEVTGSGKFVHTNSLGGVIGKGSWIATELITFDSYGPVDSSLGLPEGSEGGRALLRVLVIPDNPTHIFEGVLRISCTLGDFRPTVKEGVRFSVREAKINFNQEIHGATLFIKNVSEGD